MTWDSKPWSSLILRMEVHLPLAIATNPDASYVRVTGHTARAASGCLDRVVHEGSNVGAKKGHTRITKFNSSESAPLMESSQKREHLIPIHYLLFYIDEIWLQDFREIGSIAVNVCPPERVLLSHNHRGRVVRPRGRIRRH